MITTSETVEGTSRARLGHVESDVADLWEAVRKLEARLDGMPNVADPPLQSSLPTEEIGDSHDTPSDDDCDSIAADLSLTNPPTHLLQLLDNGLLDSNREGSASQSHHTTSLHKAKAHKSSPLRALLPSREDMLIIAASASSSLTLYNALFPAMSFAKTGDEILLQYDKLQDLYADPVAIAALLLSIALIVQQGPSDTAGRAAKTIKDTTSFVRTVSDCVEHIVISDDILAGTLEGMETTLQFIRL